MMADSQSLPCRESTELLKLIPSKGFENGRVENLKKYILTACQQGCDIAPNAARGFVYGDIQPRYAKYHMWFSVLPLFCLASGGLCSFSVG